MNGNPEEFAVWEPANGHGPEDALCFLANTHRHAAIQYMEDEYRNYPREPGTHTLEVERTRDGATMMVSLTPKVHITWTTQASPRVDSDATFALERERTNDNSGNATPRDARRSSGSPSPSQGIPR